MTGPGKRSEHVWGPSMPGQGREMVCRRCGARRSQAPEDCVGEQIETFVAEVAQHEYDPREVED